jgi:hypothetical protein
MNLAKPRTRRVRAAWRVAMLIVILPLVLGVMLVTASVFSDSNRVPADLAAAAREKTVMFCTDGDIVYDGGTWLDRVFRDGRFRCTEWRMRGGQTDAVTGAANWPTSPRR